MRKINLEEKQIVLALANNLAPGEREIVLGDISTALISIETADGSRRRFHLPGYVRPPYRGQHPYPVQGVIKDADDSEVSVRLYADENDRIFELELIKWGEGQLIAPRWSTFSVI